MSDQIILHLKGGLGNQLFQLANGLSLSIKFKKNLIINNYYLKKNIPERSLEIDKLLKKLYICNIKINLINKYFPFLFLNDQYIFEKNFFNYKIINNLNKNKNNHIIGYWQSFLYFKDVSDIFYNLIQDYFQTLNISFIPNRNSLAIHIRKGDYLSKRNLKVYFNLNEYYIKAIKIIILNKKINNIYIFTDDKNWVIKNLLSELKAFHCNLIFQEDVNSWHDLYLMTKFENFIMSNSSYSWWAAWIISNTNNNSLVISPSKWFCKFKDNLNISQRQIKSWIIV
jgi:hypothetical protein